MGISTHRPFLLGVMQCCSSNRGALNIIVCRCLTSYLTTKVGSISPQLEASSKACTLHQNTF